MNYSFDQLPQAVGELYNKIDHIEKLLLENKQGQQGTADLLTIQQASEFINLSIATIYTKVSKREIPVNKRGKKLYFSKAELSDWITSGRKKTAEELRSEAIGALSKLQKGKGN